ncbi:MAG: helix-turn-helix domain-containing protein [Acidobacteriaceae bacterium]
MQQHASVAATAKPPETNILLTVEQVAQFLSMTKRQVWEMTRQRGLARMSVPIPLIRINGNIRFKQSSLEAWVNQLEVKERTM